MKKFVTAERCRLIINSKSYTKKAKSRVPCTLGRVRIFLSGDYFVCPQECDRDIRLGIPFEGEKSSKRPQQQANKTFAKCVRFTRKLRWRLQIIQHHHVMFGLYLLFIVKTILWLATKGMLFRCLPLSPRVSPSRTRQTSSLKKSQELLLLARRAQTAVSF